jgi:hypothetical protein
MTGKDASLGPIIALIGCDGSGKSTVTEKIVVWATDYGPTATAHLGKQAGKVGGAFSSGAPDFQLVVQAGNTDSTSDISRPDPKLASR